MKKVAYFVIVTLVVFFAVTQSVQAFDTCTFINDPGSNLKTLTGDCTTDASIIIDNGYTLYGNGFTITAVDPPGGHFLGAVVKNEGAWAAVTDLTITTQNLTNICDGGGDRLRGIMFDSASGLILGNTVININQGASGCQEGNAIEVRNNCAIPLGSNIKVEIGHNTLSSWQKTGIVANCEVDADIHHNMVGASATQANLAANSIQVGFGAKASVTNNHVAGNSWTTDPNWVSTSILLYEAALGTLVQHNNLMDGNADVGIYILADGVTVDNNRVFESGPDSTYDIGIGNYGDNIITNNKVRGYTTPYENVLGGNNKTIPRPHDK